MLTTFCFLLCIVNLFVKQCGVYKVGRMSCGAKLFSVKPAFCSCEYLNSREFSVQFWSVLRFTASDNLLSMLKIFLSYVCLMPLICQQYFSYVGFVSFIGEGSRNFQWKQMTCRKLLTNLWQTYREHFAMGGKRNHYFSIQIASPRMASELKPFAGRYESNYHKIAATMNSIQIDTPDPLD